MRLKGFLADGNGQTAKIHKIETYKGARQNIRPAWKAWQAAFSCPVTSVRRMGTKRSDGHQGVTVVMGRWITTLRCVLIVAPLLGLWCLFAIAPAASDVDAVVCVLICSFNKRTARRAASVLRTPRRTSRRDYPGLSELVNCLFGRFAAAASALWLGSVRRASMQRLCLLGR